MKVSNEHSSPGTPESQTPQSHCPALHIPRTDRCAAVYPQTSNTSTISTCSFYEQLADLTCSSHTRRRIRHPTLACRAARSRANRAPILRRCAQEQDHPRTAHLSHQGHVSQWSRSLAGEEGSPHGRPPLRPQYTRRHALCFALPTPRQRHSDKNTRSQDRDTAENATKEHARHEESHWHR